MHKPTTRQMSSKHEDFIADLIGGKRTRNSGAVWSDQMDARNDVRNDQWAFAADGKATLGKSIGVSRDMWDKAVEQSHDLRTILPLRWYDTERLDVGLDLVVLSAEDFREMLEALRG